MHHILTVEAMTETYRMALHLDYNGAGIFLLPGDIVAVLTPQCDAITHVFAVVLV